MTFRIKLSTLWDTEKKVRVPKQPLKPGQTTKKGKILKEAATEKLATQKDRLWFWTYLIVTH